VALYLPNRKEILAVAERANLRNPLASARASLRDKIKSP
jgi:hypothetical protein